MGQLAQFEVERRPTLQVLRVRGEVDISNSDEFSAAIEGVAPTQANTIVVDLSETTYLDSAAVRLLIVLAERLKDRRNELRLVVPRASPIWSVLELTGVHKLIEVAPTLQAATGNSSPQASAPEG